jgi:hypothetical protein
MKSLGFILRYSDHNVSKQLNHKKISGKVSNDIWIEVSLQPELMDLLEVIYEDLLG